MEDLTETDCVATTTETDEFELGIELDKINMFSELLGGAAGGDGIHLTAMSAVLLSGYLYDIAKDARRHAGLKRSDR